MLKWKFTEEEKKAAKRRKFTEYSWKNHTPVLLMAFVISIPICFFFGVLLGIYSFLMFNTLMFFAKNQSVVR